MFDIDISSADSMLGRVDAYVAEGWKPIAAEEAKDTILELTAMGLDADGNKLHDYTAEHAAVRQTLALQTEIKDLNMLGRSRRSGDLLRGLKPRRAGTKITLAVSADPNSRANKVAHGQMFHPEWQYHHKFLAAGERMLRRVTLAVAHPLAAGVVEGLSKLKQVGLQ